VYVTTRDDRVYSFILTSDVNSLTDKGTIKDFQSVRTNNSVNFTNASTVHSLCSVNTRHAVGTQKQWRILAGSDHMFCLMT
jgi:hypothetical protein